MRSISGQLTTELKNHIKSTPVAKAEAYPITSFRKLMEHVARLAYLNKDYLLFFRGQDRDYRNKAGASTYYPSIYRGDRLSSSELDLRFDILASAGKSLSDMLNKNKLEGHQDVKRRKYIQWSILQHYEVCPTPFIDLTHSLRVACSFAFLASDKSESYLSVFGLPYFTNRISINSEHDIITIRLLSICPPDALRPYFQEGYVAGTDEITSDYESKDELDFNNRLVAKFRLKRGKAFWGKGFEAIPETALYPSSDMVKSICDELMNELGSDIQPGRLGKFLQDWTDLENLLLTSARKSNFRVFSVRQAVDILSKYRHLPIAFYKRLDNLRRLRSQAVHHPGKLSAQDFAKGLDEVKSLRSEAKQLNL